MSAFPTVDNKELAVWKAVKNLDSGLLVMFYSDSVDESG
jgi:hypothetical protein